MSLTGPSTVAVRKPDPSLIDSSGTCPSDPEGQVVGYVHSVETGGTVDGPGIRYVVFLSGCPLHCQYCHNPDTRHMSDGKAMTAAALCADIATYAPFLKRARGGVTLSGGDPLTQAAFARAVLKGCKDLGLHTVLDTSGYLGSHADEELLAAQKALTKDSWAEAARHASQCEDRGEAKSKCPWILGMATCQMMRTNNDPQRRLYLDRDLSSALKSLREQNQPQLAKEIERSCASLGVPIVTTKDAPSQSAPLKLRNPFL